MKWCERVSLIESLSLMVRMMMVIMVLCLRGEVGVLGDEGVEQKTSIIYQD